MDATKNKPTITPNVYKWGVDVYKRQIVHKETKEKIPYDDYKRMSAEEQKEYNVYPKLNVYQVFNVAPVSYTHLTILSSKYL